jgi:hypothetical protein
MPALTADHFRRVQGMEFAAFNREHRHLVFIRVEVP